MAPHFEIEFEATEDDWIALMRRQSVTPALVARARRRNMYTCIFASALWIAIVGVVGYFAARNPSFAPINACICMVIMAVASVILCRKKVSREAAQRGLEVQLESLLRQGLFGPLKGGPFHLALYDDCATSTFDGQTITFPWVAASELVMEDDAVFLEFPGKGHIRIPDRAFDAAAPRERFVSVVDQLRERAQTTRA